MQLRLNGWQRLWVFLSALYVIFPLYLQYDHDFDGTIWHLLLIWLIPVIVSYLTGVFVVWIYRGYKIYGLRQVGGWRRLWVLASIVYLVSTLGLVGENISKEVARDKVLSSPPADDVAQDYKLVPKSKAKIRKEEDLARQNGERFPLISSDERIYIPGKYFKVLGRYRVHSNGNISYSDSEISARIGVTDISVTKELVNKTGEYNKLLESWAVPREVAISIMEKQSPYHFYKQMIKIIGVWVMIPFLIYASVWGLVTGFCWVFAGFRN